MSVPVQALSQYVEVLDMRAQQSQQAAGEALRRVEHTKSQMERLKRMAIGAGVKKSHGNVALYVNAAGFRSGLQEMSEQCRDTLGVQQLEYAQAQVHMQAALKQHDSMHFVLTQARNEIALQQQRGEQKRMDELAGQAWLRQRRMSHSET